MKKIGYYLFNIIYYIFYLLPINKNKMLLIMTHDDSPEGNVLYSANYFKAQNPKLFFKKVTKETYSFKSNKHLPKKIINFFLLVPYHVATSKTIFLDNVFLPFSYTKFKKNVNIVQLWHGTGTIKKFGLDSETGEVRRLANLSCSKNTHLIVGSEEMVPIYQSAFNMDLNKIYPIGSPRTDVFFDDKLINKKIKDFFNIYPDLSDKKIILYAPTFRDEEYEEKYKKEKSSEKIINGVNTDIFNILKYLNDDYILILRLHPYISDKFSFENLKSTLKIKLDIDTKKIYDFSNFNDLNSLLFISDILITDYSSIIFEYCLLNKNIIFYPYDLNDFKKDSRGFYFDYEKFVPGPIFFNPNDIANQIIDFNEAKKDNRLADFKYAYIKECDGKSRKKLYALVK